MSSTSSLVSGKSAELPVKEKPIWEYSPDSESIVDASSSCGRLRGQEGASPSGREEASPISREDRAGGHSPLAELFSYPTPVLRQSRETGESASSMRAGRTDFEEGVGTSHPSPLGEAFITGERRLVVEIPQLRDESLSLAELPNPQVKIEKGNWSYNSLTEKERLEAWVGCGLAEVVQKKKKSRRKQRPPPGSSWCDEDSLDTLRQECGIPDAVEMIMPTPEQREDDPPVGTFTAYECWFKGCYLTFPIPKLFLRYTWVHRIALAQINTRGIRQLVGLQTRAAECGEPIGVRHLRNFLEFRKHLDASGKRLYNLASRPHYKVLDDFPNKDHSWRKYFFFVLVSTASVEEEDRVVAKWGTLVCRPLFTPVPGIDDLQEKLKARKCLWSRHFNHRRVIRARESVLDDEEEEIEQSESDDLEIMPPKPTIRDLAKKKAAKARKKADPQANFSIIETSEQSIDKVDTPVAEGDGAAAVAATGALAVMISQPTTATDELAEPEEQLARKRKRSASEQGKGKVGEKKRSRRELPALSPRQSIPPGPRSGSSDELYNDPLAAAALMAKVTYPGDRMPIPERLVKSELYKEFASRQAKAIAHFNRLIISYDQDSRSKELFIGEARQKEEAEKEQVAAQLRLLAQERDVYRKSSDDMGLHLHRVGKEKDELAKELSALKASRKRDLEEAVSSARRSAVAEVQGQLGRAYELFHQMMKKPFKKMVYLAQADANLQLLDDMEKPNPEEPFDPKAERALLVENKKSLGKADEIFDAMTLELKKTLGKNYVVPINLRDLVFSPRVEISAKSVGVNAASGSNDGSLGLRLQNESEDSSDSESGESDGLDDAADPTPAAGSEPRIESAPLEQGPKAGEVASSAAIVAPAEAEDVEEGEVVAVEKEAEAGEPIAKDDEAEGASLSPYPKNVIVT